MWAWSLELLSLYWKMLNHHSPDAANSCPLPCLDVSASLQSLKATEPVDMNGVSETRNPNKSASFKLIFSSVLSLWWKKNNKWSVHSLHKHTYRSHVRWPDPASGRRTQEDQEFKVIFGYIASSRSALGYIRPCLRNKTAQPSKEISTIKEGRNSISLLLAGNILT